MSFIQNLINFLNIHKEDLRTSISNLVNFKKRFYKNELYDEVRGKGLISEFEAAQDKYIATLCSFGLTKNEILYILPNEPFVIQELDLGNLTPQKKLDILVQEYDFGHYLRILDVDKEMLDREAQNALDDEMVNLARLFDISEQEMFKSVGTRTRTGTGRGQFVWPGEVIQEKWNSMPREEKMAILDTIWVNSEGHYTKFKNLRNEALLILIREYLPISDYIKRTQSQILEHSDDLIQAGKMEKIKRIASLDTQCSGSPQLFDTQDASIMWEYLKNENPEYFSLATKYQTVVDIIKKIIEIENQLSTDNGWNKYFDRLISTLEKFDTEIIGREDLKKWIADEVEAFVNIWQVFKRKHLNITLEGPPGSGKTTIARNIGPVFSQLGILIIGKFRVVSRSDLVGQYVGQTADKVKGILNSMIESVLFIDEAYALACNDPVTNTQKIDFDQYGIEAINEIVNFLDKNSGNVMIIAAGYIRDMKYCFFGANPGLERRFPKRYFLQNMSGVELYNIFIRNVKVILDKEFDNEIFTDTAISCVKNLIENTADYWVNQAGDMENLASIVASKYAAKRTLLTSEDFKIIVEDIFSDKDLTRMSTLPLQIENEKLENFDEARVQEFLDTYVKGNEKKDLLEIVKTGKRLATLDPESLYWLSPIDRFNLSEAIREQKESLDSKIKRYFKEELFSHCPVNNKSSKVEEELQRNVENLKVTQRRRSKRTTRKKR